MNEAIRFYKGLSILIKKHGYNDIVTTEEAFHIGKRGSPHSLPTEEVESLVSLGWCQEEVGVESLNWFNESGNHLKFEKKHYDPKCHWTFYFTGDSTPEDYGVGGAFGGSIHGGI